MVKIDSNFWQLIENSENLKYVIYGDSITEDESVLAGLKLNNYTLSLVPFIELWNLLVTKIPIVIHEDKEYLYITDELKVATYADESDELILTTPSYLVRHKINKEICQLNFNRYPAIKVTHDHSLLTYNADSNSLIPIKPKDASYIAILRTYYYPTLKDYKIYKNLKIPNSNYVLISIKSKEDIQYNGYVYDFSVPETENFIVNGFIVHNTDSLYVNVPNLKYESVEEVCQTLEILAETINSIIENILNSYLLPKMGVNPKYNKTYFKTESIISDILFLDIKKNYAYKEIAKKGKIYDKPSVAYTGIPVVRSDYSKFAQDFIRKLIEDIALTNTPNKLDLLNELAAERYALVNKCTEEFDFKYIATPGKWKLSNNYKTETFTVIAMRLYNTIMDTEVFRPGADGMTLPITILNPTKFLDKISINKSRSKYFLNNINIDNINYIAVPSNYEVDEVKSKFEEYHLALNTSEIWKKNFSKIAHGIVDVIKASVLQS